jgi:hypothetical protein
MNTLKFLNEKKDKDIKYIRNFFYKNYIKTSGKDVIDNEERIIFNSNRSKSNFTNPISFECNGLIAKFDESKNRYNLLVFPPANFNLSKLKRNNINSFYKKKLYTLHKVYDGTNVNLYYYNDCWVYSSTKGFDVNNLIFLNNKTYLDVINEILLNYPDFNYNNLDKTKCYSLVFKYYEYHPFIMGKKTNYEQFNQMILLQSVNMEKINNENKLDISYTDNIGLPIQERVEFNTNDINDIFNITQNAYQEYISYLKINRPDIYNNNNIDTPFLTNGDQLMMKNYTKRNYTPNFGFILRSTDFNTTKEYSNILIESSLLSNIRQMIYNHKIINNYKQNISGNNNINNENYYNCKIESINTLDFNKLKSLITINKHYIFKSLFPQYSAELYNINQFLYNYLPLYILNNKEVLYKNIHNIHNIMNDTYTINTNVIDMPRFKNNNINELNKLSLLLLIDINNSKLNLNVFEGKSILTDYIVNMKYIYIYYKYIFIDNTIQE